MLKALESWEGRTAEFELWMAYGKREHKLKKLEKDIEDMEAELADFVKAAADERRYMAEIEAAFHAISEQAIYAD